MLETLLFLGMWEEVGERQSSSTSPNGRPLRLETGQMDGTSSVHKSTSQLSGQGL